MAEAETRQEAERQDNKAGFWLEEIQRAGKREDKWRKEAMKVVKRYRNEEKAGRSLNILYANTELLKPAVLGRSPKPDVRQRFFVEDPLAHTAADVLEKALAFIADDPDYAFKDQLDAARDDMLLPGRGVVRVVYESDVSREELQHVEEEDGSITYEDSTGNPTQPDTIDENGFAYRESIGSQEVCVKHVYWEDYREGDARCWEDVPWIAYRHTYTRKQLKDNFDPEKAILVPLPLGPKSETSRNEDKNTDPDNPLNQAIVWEVWDKQERKRIWVAEGFKDDVLAVDDDPLGLEGFFPQPDPLYAVRNTDKRIPVPEFRIYRDQADELDSISLRIKRLIDAIKVRGVYAAVVKEMGDLMSSDENELIPVEDWAGLKDKGGLEGAMAFLPIEMIANVLLQLYQQREQLKSEIYELTGISDLLRGDTNPNETATAQRIKGTFGNIRLEPRQQPMQQFCRSIFRIAAEIMAEHFTWEHLSKMTGIKLPSAQEAQMAMMQAQQQGQQPPQMVTSDDVMASLRDQKIRGFTVDIETDSTIAPDAQAEQQSVSEFMAAVSEYFTAVVPIMTMVPNLAPLFLETFKSGARRFKFGRELDEVIEKTMGQMGQAAANPPPPQPDPKAEADKAKSQMDVQKSQMDLMTAQQKHQMDMEKMREQRVTDLLKMKAQRKAINKPNGQSEGTDNSQPEDDGSEVEMFGTMLSAMMHGQQQQTEALIKALTAPKQIVRGPDGKAQAVATVQVQ